CASSRQACVRGAASGPRPAPPAGPTTGPAFPARAPPAPTARRRPGNRSAATAGRGTAMDARLRAGGRPAAVADDGQCGQAARTGLEWYGFRSTRFRHHTMYSRSSEPVRFERDCAAVLVPQGDEVTLPAGTVGYITQSLGGSWTVFVEGNLMRI